jgi:hypothetical protein
VGDVATQIKDVILCIECNKNVRENTNWRQTTTHCRCEKKVRVHIDCLEKATQEKFGRGEKFYCRHCKPKVNKPL